MSEKALARRLDVQFTPTLLFFDERGKVVARLNGYYPPHRFEAVLDYVAGRHERDTSLGACLARHVARRREPARSPTSPSSCRRRTIFARSRGGKPLAVLFETPYCGPCDELHREGFERAAGARAPERLRRRALRLRRVHAD